MTETLTRTWSASAFSQYTECGEAFRLKRVEKVPARPSVSQVGGLAFHSWTDMYDGALWATDVETDWDNTPPWAADLPETYEELFDKHAAELEESSGFDFDEFTVMGSWNRAAYINNATGWCDAYAKWRHQDRWEIATGLPEDKHGVTIGVEYYIEYQCGDVTVRGYVDRIWRLPDTGELVAIDTKTWGNERPSSQLIGYKLGLNALGIPVTQVGYYEARKGETPKLKDYRGWNMDRLRLLYEQAAWSEYDGFYIPNPGKHCFTCDVKAHCLFKV